VKGEVSGKVNCLDIFRKLVLLIKVFWHYYSSRKYTCIGW